MKIVKFFDKLEDKIRNFLSHYPIPYAFIAGVGLVLFWRGVWHTTDGIAEIIWHDANLHTTINILSSFWDGPISLIIGSGILLSCGLFVPELLGKEIIISGLRGEKKLAEKTEGEVRTETGAIGDIRHEIRTVLRRLQSIEKKLEEKGVGEPSKKQ